MIILYELCCNVSAYDGNKLAHSAQLMPAVPVAGEYYYAEGLAGSERSALSAVTSGKRSALAFASFL